MSRRQAALLALLVVGIAAVAAALALRGSDHAAPSAAQEPKSRAELIAANYRVLTPAQSRKLIRFAEDYATCMAAAGVDVGRPKALDTKLVMRVPAGAEEKAVLRRGIRCGESLGDPPPGASLVLRGRTIELYLPKQCLLDEKVVAAG